MISMSNEINTLNLKDASDFLEWYEYINNARKQLSVICKYYKLDDKRNNPIMNNNFQQLKYVKKTTDPINNRSPLNDLNQEISWKLTKSSTRNAKSKTLNVENQKHNNSEEEENKEIVYFELSVTMTIFLI